MRWRIGLVAVIAAAVVGGFVPHGVLSAAETLGHPGGAGRRSSPVRVGELRRRHLRQGQHGTRRALAGHCAGGRRGRCPGRCGSCRLHPAPAGQQAWRSRSAPATPCFTRRSSPSSNRRPRAAARRARAATGAARAAPVISPGGRPAASLSSLRACAPLSPRSANQGEHHVEVPTRGRRVQRGPHQQEPSTEHADTKSNNDTNPPSRPRRPIDAHPPRGKRFRTRHPVLTALVPVVLVVAAIATMVVIKAGRDLQPVRLGVLAPDHGGADRRSSHRRPGHHHAVPSGPRRAHRADGDARRGGQPLLGRPAHQDREAAPSPRAPTASR